MAARALSAPIVERTVGGVWDLLVDVRDACGQLVADVPVVTVTLPNTTTATPPVETVTTGVYRAEYLPAAAGRYTARAVTTSHGAVDFAAHVSAVTTGTGVPTVAQFRNYAREDFGSYDDDEIQSTLDTEAAAQRRVCRVGAVIDPDLREALLRRVRVNLSRRGQPVLVTVDADGNNTFLPDNDPEVRRLEKPHRKLPIG
jgi:hypothetical protein